MDREYLYDRPGVAGTAGSTWLADRERPAREPLRGLAGADVAVVGGGLCGTLTAWRLAQSGAKVALIEGRRIGGLVTGHTTAKATAQHGLLTRSIPSDVRVPWLKANVRAVDDLESLARTVGEKARFRRADSHVFAFEQSGVRAIEDEARLYADAALPGGLLESGLPPGVLAAARLESQAQFDPVALIDGLLDNAPANLTVYEHSLVQSVDEDGDVVVLSTGFGELRADAAVIASHVPFFDTLLYLTRLYQERSYAFEVELPEPADSAIWYSEDSGSFAWRTVDGADGTHLIVSGGGHKAGQGGDERTQYAALESRTRRMFGDRVRFVRHWSTQDAHTPDGLPYVGKMHGRQRCFVASGFRGWGMTSSMVAAGLLTALVRGEDHELAEMLTPARVSAAGVAKLAVENADFIAKAFTHELSQPGDPEEVEPGFGATMRTSEGHIAVLRESDGTTRLLDAHCTHMRCAVEFNEAEGTWDCPCHGSRFYGDGSWLHGPTRRGLEHVGGSDRKPGTDGG